MHLTKIEDYFEIPENEKLFFDILIKNASVLSPKYKDEIGILFKEILEEKEIVFQPSIEKLGNLIDYHGHKEFDCLKSKDLELLKKDANLRGLLFYNHNEKGA